MNDPLRRKMFREAGMSKQPMGILASSPELINAAQSPGYALRWFYERYKSKYYRIMPYYIFP
jgi:hypothetical protein